MEDAGPPIMARRKSIAGPFMRSSAGISADHRPMDDDFESNIRQSPTPATAPMNIPPPLTRSNTGSGWFSGWFTRRSTSITSPPTTDPTPIFKRAQAMGADLAVNHTQNYDDNHANLASSAPQIAPPHVGSSRDFLFNSTGSLKTNSLNSTVESGASSQANVPPLMRRRSETGLGKGSKNEATPSSSPIAITEPVDARPGIETDLFWMVLRDIGE